MTHFRVMPDASRKVAENSAIGPWGKYQSGESGGLASYVMCFAGAVYAANLCGKNEWATPRFSKPGRFLVRSQLTRRCPLP